MTSKPSKLNIKSFDDVLDQGVRLAYTVMREIQIGRTLIWAHEINFTSLFGRLKDAPLGRREVGLHSFWEFAGLIRITCIDPDVDKG